MLRIQGGVQNYAWGRPGQQSWVSSFIPAPIEDSLPYAEYWLGTHPSLPSRIGADLLCSVTGSLPYLFKVLSIAKPLSIQLHPNKAQAEKLHAAKPHLYPDNNYKPELCIAKEKLRLFIGFKAPSEINTLLDCTPELLAVVGRTDLQQQLSNLYKNEAETKHYIENYCARVSEGVFSELSRHYPGDSGIFFAMFMNYLELSKGECVVIGAGVPHCYIEGECIEAMACSDNVVRAGLTPKPKDVDTLLEVRPN